MAAGFRIYERIYGMQLTVTELVTVGRLNVRVKATVLHLTSVPLRLVASPLHNIRAIICIYIWLRHLSARCSLEAFVRLSCNHSCAILPHLTEFQEGRTLFALLSK